MKSSANELDSTVDTNVLRDAFHAAVEKDAETIATRGGKLYIVPRRWMAALMDFIGDDDDGLDASRGEEVGKIIIEPLLQPDDVNIGLSSSPLSTDNSGFVDDRTARRERWTKIKQAKEGNIRKDLKFLIDYTLVGEGLWTLLSSKFGFDFSLTFMIEEQGHVMDNDSSMNGNEVDIDSPNNVEATAVTPSIKIVRVGNQTVTLPADGKFDYSSLLSLEDEDDDNDVSSEQMATIGDNFSDCPDLDDTSRNDKPPLLLLPPSSTIQPTTAISLDGMQVDQVNEVAALSASDDDSGEAIKTRKRKRYGSGLGNLGNTCFMNSTLQCLAHTGPLRSYFLSGEYAKDLNRDNPLGTGGELATEFAKLLMEMWGTVAPKQQDCGPTSSLYASRYNTGYRKSSWSSSSPSVVYPRDFKYTLGKHAERFMGYNQHDSQELAMYLLDALHEDTNRVSKKPYIEKPEQQDDESDEEAAAKAWELHLQRDNSKVLENFMGQIKSKVVCPRETCGRVSTTFEPVMYLSVPLPGTTETTIEVTFVGISPAEYMRKLNVTLSKTADIRELAVKISVLVNQTRHRDESVDASNIVIAEIWNKEVYKFYDKTDEVAKINETDAIFAYEVASLDCIHADMDSEHDYESYNDQTTEVDQEENFRTSLDEETITKLNISWEDVLASYLAQPSSLPSLLNQKRNTHEDRMSFHKKLNNFLYRCYSSQEYKAALIESKSAEITGKMSPTSTVLSKLGATAVDDAQTLEEICHVSSLFRNVSKVQDIQVLDFCRKKFHEATINLHIQKIKENQDGAEIQVNFRKPSIVGASDSACGVPIVLRVSPNLTVYGLRKMLAYRLSRVLNVEDSKCNHMKSLATEQRDDYMSIQFGDNSDKKADLLQESDESLRIMCQLPLTYEHKGFSYNSFRSGSYRKLGSIAVEQSLKAVDRRLTTFAMANDESENEYVLDIVGKQGKVQIHFPAKDSFDDETWEKHECQVMNVDKNKPNGISILDCIHKYCEMEQLDESEMWYCDRCREHVPAWKHIHLYRTPPILIVHLKRFHYNAVNHRRDKIDLLVHFPLVGLDLRDQVMHWNPGEEPVYDCYAVSNHFGGLGGGHYTAFALNDEGEWCNFDDSRVTKNVTESEVVSSAAYLLFYRRRDVKVDDDIWMDRPMPSSTNIPSAVSSLDSMSSSGRMDVGKDGEVTDEEAGEGIESDTMITSTPTSSSPIIGSVTDDGDEDSDLP